MSGKIEISRGLAERITKEPCSVDDQVRRQDAVDELRAFLAAEECCHEFVPFQPACVRCGEPYVAAPVVERQEPVAPVFTMPSNENSYGFGYVDGTCIQSLRGYRDHLEEIVDSIPEGPLYRSPPAPVAVVQQCKIGIYGKAYDAPETKRAYTYEDQPDNLGAHKLGKAAIAASLTRGGDLIDSGLSLLRSLHGEGFGVFEIDACLDKVKEMNRPATPYKSCQCGACPGGCVAESKP